MQPIVPIVTRTGKPEIDRNLDAIATAFRRLSEAIGEQITNTTTTITQQITQVTNNVSTDDHKVDVDATDTPEYLDEKVLVDSSMTKTVVANAAGDGRALLLGAKPVPPNPTTDGARLYPAAIAPRSVQSANAILAPLYRWADVYCCFLGGHTKGSNTDMFADFTEISPGVFERTTTGPLPDFHLDGTSWDAYNTSGVSTMLNKRVLAWYQGDVSGSNPHDNMWQGPMVIKDVGGHYENYGTPSQTFVNTHVRLERATDADISSDFVNRKIVNVLHGTLYGGHTLLYTGSTQPEIDTAPLQFEDHGAASMFASISNGTSGFGTVWTAAPGVCTWQKNGEGAGGVAQPPASTRFLAAEGIPGDEVLLGARYLIRDGTPFDGLYEIQTYGSFQQVIRRVAEVNEASELTGVVVHIVSAEWHANDYFHQTATITTIDVDATSWVVTSSNPLTQTDELLTGSQLTSEGASSDTYTITRSVDSSQSMAIWAGGPTTLVGTPSLSKLPKGRETCQAKVRVKDWNPTTNPGTVTISMTLFTLSLTELFTAPCGVPLSPDWQTLNWQFDLGADVAMLPSDRMVFNLVATTTCTSAVTVEVEYNSASRPTWVQLAGVQFSVAGTDDHQLLKNRDAVNTHYGVGTATAVDGIIPAPTKSDMVITVSGSDVMFGIDATGLESGVKLDLTFLQACAIADHAAPLPDGVVPFRLNGWAIDWKSPSPTTGGRIGVTYYKTELPDSPCFKLRWGPNP